MHGIINNVVLITMSKVKIHLKPYTCLAIVRFCREFVNEETKGEYQFKSIQDAVDEFEKQVLLNMSVDQLEDASVENSINKLIGKCPQK